MALVPMRVEPGELLTTTECEEDVDYNQLWDIPDEWEGIKLAHGDLLMVVAALEETTVLLHLRTNCLTYVADIAELGWLFRPDPAATEWRHESR